MTLLAHPGHTLVKHLAATAEKAAEFARHFGGEKQARLAGMFHDLGKAEAEFQKRVNSDDREGRKESHAHHGAALILADTDRGAPIWPVAFAINGHHAGLHNRYDVDKHRKELQKAKIAEAKVGEDAKAESLSWPITEFTKKAEDGKWEYLPDWLGKLQFDARQTSEGWRAVDLYTRFLFSALVDADRLDTEGNDPKSKIAVEARTQWNKFNAEVLLCKLYEHIEGKRRKAKTGGASALVLAVRDEVGQACEKTGAENHRIRSLTVPTGGGKTLASMLFALHYAKHHPNIRRVIVVIPYLSIIQQNAKEFEEAFGSGWVLEHHSQAEDPEIKTTGKNKDDDGWSEEMMRHRYAAENWDAPIIVTTSVQFFDSIFSRSPGDARKLHNIAQSVIIFDEVQTLPPRLMQPILDVLGELTNKKRFYGCSMVLCTATQPALLRNDDFTFGFTDTCPIIPDEKCKEHFNMLQRTEYPKFSVGEIPSMKWEAVADEILQTPRKQGLAVVNTRKAARQLFNTLKTKGGKQFEEAVFHLSTWMYPAHRIQALDEVRRRLDSNEPCYLISTQCIEAGVDVDFPAVWRAYGPYDSIVQAAGRCNRNGNLKDEHGNPTRGIVRVFKPEDEKMPRGLYETATNQTDLLRRIGLADPYNPDSFTAYFRLLYQLSVPDDCEIQRERGQLHFENVSERFRFIEDNTFPVLILDYVQDGKRGETESLPVCKEARKRGFFLREDWRTFQKHIINLPRYNLGTLQAKGLIEPALPKDDGLFVLTGEAAYSGGLNGVGVIFAPDYSERTIL